MENKPWELISIYLEKGAWLIIALVVGVFFLPALAAPNLLIWPHSGLGSDISYRHWPDLIGYAANLGAGRMALWDPLVALGRPLAGDPGVLFMYPPAALFVILPPALAFNTLNALHVFLAGLFMFLFLRKGYDLSAAPAVLGALSFAFMPKLISHLAGGHVGLVWGFTWAPAVLLGLRLAFEGDRLAAAGAGLALAMQMPTHIQIPYYTAVMASAFWLWHLIPAIGRRAWQQVKQLIIAYLVWLFAFALLAAVVLLPLFELLPYNSRAKFSVADANFYALNPWLLVTLLVPSNFQFPEWTMFVGLLPPLLGAVSFGRARRAAAIFFALLAGFALVYTLGDRTPLYPLALTLIPGFRLLRVPTRLWFFGGLAIAVLAGFGAEMLADEQLRQGLRRRAQWLGLATGGYVTGGLIAWLGYWIAAGRWHEPMAWRLLTAGIVIVLGVSWLQNRLSRLTLQWLLVPVLLLDLLPLDAAQIDLVDPRAAFLRTTSAFDFVSTQPGLFRVYSASGDFPYALAAKRGVETLEGLLAFQIGHAVQAVREAAGCAQSNYSTAIPPCLHDKHPTARPDAARLGALNVRYVLTHQPLTDPNFKLVLSDDPAVYENLLWRPRAYVPAGKVEIVNNLAGEYEIMVSSDEPTRLTVSETWLPGWQATVDGKPIRVERAENAGLSLPVAAGKHRVRLRYLPLGWRLGWPISMAALVGLGAWAILTLWRANARWHTMT